MQPQMESYSRHVLVCTGDFCSPDRRGRQIYSLLASLLERWDRTHAEEFGDALAALVARNEEEVLGIRRLFVEVYLTPPAPAVVTAAPRRTFVQRWMWSLAEPWRTLRAASQPTVTVTILTAMAAYRSRTEVLLMPSTAESPYTSSAMSDFAICSGRRTRSCGSATDSRRRN